MGRGIKKKERKGPAVCAKCDNATTRRKREDVNQRFACEPPARMVRCLAKSKTATNPKRHNIIYRLDVLRGRVANGRPFFYHLRPPPCYGRSCGRSRSRSRCRRRRCRPRSILVRTARQHGVSVMGNSTTVGRRGSVAGQAAARPRPVSEEEPLNHVLRQSLRVDFRTFEMPRWEIPGSIGKNVFDGGHKNFKEQSTVSDP